MARARSTAASAARIARPAEARSRAAERQAEEAGFRAAASVMMARAQLAARAGISFDGSRDTYKALGYRRDLLPQDYVERYERGGIAERIVEAYPRATWTAGSAVVEDEDPTVETPFETAAQDLFERLDVWANLQRVDILAGQGQYAVLLFGAADGEELDKPLAEDSSGSAKLIYLTPLGQLRAQVLSFVQDPQDERFALPEYYQVNFGLLGATPPNTVANTVAASGFVRRVHHSRVIHVADGVLDNLVYGKSRLRACWNNLDDLEKIVGGGSEAAWKHMDMGLHANVDPTLKLKSGALDKLNEELEDWRHGMSRFIKTVGVDVNPLQSQASSFGGNADAVLKLISGTTGIPQRILLGSERGQLASENDRDNWNDRVSERRLGFAEPLVAKFLRHCTKYGFLPVPKDRPKVYWPESEELDEKSKATVVSALATANAAQVNAGGGLIITSDEMRDSVLDMDPIELPPAAPSAMPSLPGSGVVPGALPAAIPPSVGPGAQPLLAAKMRMTAARRAKRTTAPPGTAAGARSLVARVIQRAADAHRGAVAALFVAAWLAAASTLSATELERAVSAGDIAVERAVGPALDAANHELRSSVAEALRACLASGGEAELRATKSRGSWRSARRRAAADEATFSLDMEFDVTNPRAVAWAEANAARLVTEVDDATRNAIRELVARGLDEGISPALLADELRASIGLRSDQVDALATYAETGASPAQLARYANQLLDDRADNIARTETLGAANAGQRELWLQAQDDGVLPADEKRVWETSRDADVRPEHQELEGQVRGINEPFVIPSSGRQIEPGEDPRCRCGQGIATPEDLAR